MVARLEVCSVQSLSAVHEEVMLLLVRYKMGDVGLRTTLQNGTLLCSGMHQCTLKGVRALNWLTPGRGAGGVSPSSPCLLG